MFIRFSARIKLGPYNKNSSNTKSSTVRIRQGLILSAETQNSAVFCDLLVIPVQIRSKNSWGGGVGLGVSLKLLTLQKWFTYQNLQNFTRKTARSKQRFVSYTSIWKMLYLKVEISEFPGGGARDPLTRAIFFCRCSPKVSSHVRSQPDIDFYLC